MAKSNKFRSHLAKLKVISSSDEREIKQVVAKDTASEPTPTAAEVVDAPEPEAEAPESDPAAEELASIAADLDEVPEESSTDSHAEEAAADTVDENLMDESEAVAEADESETKEAENEAPATTADEPDAEPEASDEAEPTVGGAEPEADGADTNEDDLETKPDAAVEGESDTEAKTDAAVEGEEAPEPGDTDEDELKPVSASDFASKLKAKREEAAREGKHQPKHIAVATDDADDVTYQAPEDTESRGVKRTIIAVFIVLAVFAAAYLYGVTYFSDHFLPNTSLNGEDVSLKTVSEVAQNYGKAAEEYSLSIKGQDFTLSLDASSVGIDSDGKAYAKAALAQTNPWTWPYAFVSRRSLTGEDVTVEYDKRKLEEVLGSAVDNYNGQAKQPVDAKLAYDEKSKLFAITPEVMGTALDRDAIIKKAGEAIEGLEAEVTLTEDDLLKPSVYATDEVLATALEKVNGCLSATQVLRIADKNVFTFDSELIGKFAKVSDDYQFSIDLDALTEWAQGELSEKLDSLGYTRTYTRPDGKTSTVTGGTYGWCINGAETARLIADNVNAGKAASIDVPMISTGETYNPGGQDWGKRYIDIDLSEQHVRFYDDSGNLVWESDCVTGNSSKDHDTPTGVYFINSNKEEGNVKLVGEENKETGEPGYTSYVTYWMPFIWDSVALHDAPWRYSFGGTIYQTDGSHGCVNLPADKAQELFYLCEVGDPVVVHY